MTRRLLPEFETCPDPALVARWEAVLGKAPRLRPWLGQMLGQRRALLVERGNGEHLLWVEVERWLRDFEALPQFAVSAIATTLEDEPPAPSRPAPRLLERDTHSPEDALTSSRALAADPAFALAFHCVVTKVHPRLATDLAPQFVWCGLLHASLPRRPTLTADAAVGLVLRDFSALWNDVEGAARRAALRLFSARPADLRAAHVVERLRAELPWPLPPESIAAFVAAAENARAGLDEACKLAGRLAASARSREGGLASIETEGPEATAAELKDLRETARVHSEMPGFGRLLSAL